MKYIGPFFRMNSISKDDITNQLFYLAKESLKSIALNSKCGICIPTRSSKKSSHTNDINILEDFYPLLCLYKKSSATLVHSKNSKCFDESSFRKEIIPFNNALMTLSLLELSSFYDEYNKKNRVESSFKDKYLLIAKNQLDFYCTKLRNSEGFFISKINLSEPTAKNFNLINSDKKMCFPDQAFMMNAFYLYSLYSEDNTLKDTYKNFSLEILSMFDTYKDELYKLSFDEDIKILFAFITFYNYSKEIICKTLIIDLCDFLINKFTEKNYFEDSIDSTSLFAICLKNAFIYTDILAFEEKGNQILSKLEDLYDEKNCIFSKSSDKKEIKYSALEISFYMIALLLYSNEEEQSLSNRGMLFNLYKKLFIDSGIVLSWPEAPTLDEIERYRNLSLRSEDMLAESHFRMLDLPSPESSGIASVFNRSVTYSRKKDSFSHSKESFDSGKNMFIFYAIIYLFKDSVKKDMYLEFQNTNTPINPDTSPSCPLVNSDDQTL